MPSSAPTISIGMPVFNAENTLIRAIDSLLGQTFGDFELIISDNCSDDRTASICQEYCRKDHRVRYFKQIENIGAIRNFLFVLQEARGRYYTWAAGDDLRSPDYLQQTFQFLENNPDYVAATTPNCFEGQEGSDENWIRFELSGNTGDRILTFFDYCWLSHGIFYSLTRTEILRECRIVGQSFTAADWAINLFLASRGKIHRTQAGLTVFGRKGISSGSGAWRAFRSLWVEWIFPFYRLSLYVKNLTLNLPFRYKIKIYARLVQLNSQAARLQLMSTLRESLPIKLRARFKEWSRGS